MTDPITTRSSAEVVESAWSRSVLRKALLAVMVAPDNLDASTIAAAPLDFASRLTQTSVRVLRSKAGMSKKEPRRALKNDFLDGIVGERIREESEQKNNFCEQSLF